MPRQTLTWVGVVVMGSALGWGDWARGQQPVQPVKVEVTVPAVPNVPSIGAVAPSQPPSELTVALGEWFTLATAGPITSPARGTRATPCSATRTTYSGPRT